MTGIHDILLQRDLFNRTDVVDVLIGIRKVLTGHGLHDDALMLALITRAILDGRVNLEDDRQVIA